MMFRFDVVATSGLSVPSNMPLLEAVRRTIRQHDLAGASSRVAVAVSGGPDSVALLHLLDELRRANELQLAGVLHFNHQLRPGAGADEQHVSELAARFGLPFLSDRADVGALARQERRSVEDVAHTVRHAFFLRGAASLGADSVALGHTRNDQAETFLLRLLRGAGPRGLAGMHPRSGIAIRPLLDCHRDELRRYVEARGACYCLDESNEDRSIPRNRIRAELIPWLASQFNPAIVDVLSDEATLMQAQHAHLEGESGDWLARFCEDSKCRAVMEARPLLQAPLAVARAVIHTSLSRVSGMRHVSFTQVERVLEVARGNMLAFDGPGVRVERIAKHVVLTGRPVGHRGRWRPDVPNSFHHLLPVPGEVHVEDAKAAVSAEVVASWAGPAGSREVAAVQMAAAERLAVRNRRPGDRFQPLGCDGRKKLQDFFTDRKVAREVRDRVPLVVDSADRIVWVAGHSIDEAFRVRDSAQSVIILRLKAVGGSV